MNNQTQTIQDPHENLAAWLAFMGEKAQAAARNTITQIISVMTLCAEVRDGLVDNGDRAYFDWAKQWLGYSQSTARKKLRIGRWLQEVYHHAPIFLNELPTCERSLDDLRRIPVDLLEEFKTSHPTAFGPNSDDSGTINKMVNAFLDKHGIRKPSCRPSQLDLFIDYAQLPDVDRLLQGLSDPQIKSKIDFDKERALLHYHLRCINIVTDEVDEKQLKQLAKDFSVCLEGLDLELKNREAGRKLATKAH